MNFVSPSAEELSAFRTDVILFEQTLDAKPGVAEALENALGFRAGRKREQRPTLRYRAWRFWSRPGVHGSGVRLLASL